MLDASTSSDETISSRGVPGNTIPGTSTCFRRRCRTTFAYGHISHNLASNWTVAVCAQGDGVEVYVQEGLAVFGGHVLTL